MTPPSNLSIALRLEPSKLENPDLDLRWELERLIKSRAPSLSFVENGYGFCRHSDAMLVSYTVSDLPQAIAAVIAILENELVLGNDLASAVIVGTSESVTAEFSSYSVVYPAKLVGSSLPD